MKQQIEDALQDFWVGISPELDMNIFIDGNGGIKISIYTVKDGNTSIMPVAMALAPEVYYPTQDDENA